MADPLAPMLLLTGYQIPATIRRGGVRCISGQCGVLGPGCGNETWRKNRKVKNTRTPR
ncbi:hypothetical protein [Streptomyces aureocirculatus]|uniref:hypothetical protein n=1 Tax=Streptomyces aureocirculatus TaxID=67275 RepID=UPI000AD8F03B|nr:hypothetical protein [Streptomyces aureocirculatus]